MEKLSKKFIMIPLMGLIMTTLAGCGGNTNSSSNTPSQSESEVESETSTTTPAKPTPGYVKLDELTITSPTYNDGYPEAVGHLNVLCIPVQLDNSGYKQKLSWDKNNLDRFKKEMFGSRFDSTFGWNTMKSYYETASMGRLTVDGMVSEVFTPTDPNLTMKKINKDKTYNSLFKLFADACTWVKAQHPEVDWSTYDENGDGRLDAVHLITNAPGQNEIGWGSVLWPHMGNTFATPNPEDPIIDTYSVSSLGHFENARTQIHEQGHMIGLEDYYDYTGASVSYIGKADMQDSNTFDWNSFSKMSVGWVEPYVIDGTKDVTTITIGAASLTGDCLVIPADYKTYNKSAFDEYFLIELFSPFGNNEFDWTHCMYPGINERIDYGEFGVKMYHVDARLWGYEDKTDDLAMDINMGYEINDLKDIEAAKAKGDNIIIGTNNTLNYADYAYPGCMQWGDYPLLSLIQRGTNTLGRMGWPIDGSDLFQEGDVFKFKEHSSHLSKMMDNPKKMDNGEVFPYEIEFKAMSKEEVTIEVRKVR